jgi:uroporphyrinogen-III synthase
VTAHDSTAQPLSGRRILVTRAPHQASELTDRLRALGATPILIPTIEIVPPSSYAALDAALAALAGFDVVAFTSVNAVEAFQQRAELLGITPAPQRVAVVGRATERAVQATGLHVHVVPPIFTAESLAETLRPEALDRRFLLVLAENAPTTLHDGLVAAGAEVTVADAYSNHVPAASLAAMTSLFGDTAAYPDAVTFTSASTANNLIALLETAQLKLPEAVTRASIGPVTSRALSELNLPPHIEASESTIPALVDCLAAHFDGG